MLLIDVLTGLGGASQERSAARVIFSPLKRESAVDSDVARAFCFAEMSEPGAEATGSIRKWAPMASAGGATAILYSVSIAQ